MSGTAQKTFVFTPDAIADASTITTLFNPSVIVAQAVVLKGLVYASGNLGCDKDLKIVEGGVQAQTRAALQNLSIVLKAAGSGLEHIVKANVYLTNLPRDFQQMNEVYTEFFEAGKMPARTCVGVTHLPLGGDVEIECVAELASSS